MRLNCFKESKSGYLKQVPINIDFQEESMRAQEGEFQNKYEIGESFLINVFFNVQKVKYTDYWKNYMS